MTEKDGGSGRTPAGQFSERVVDGIKSTSDRPEGKRKHWPKPGDAVEEWLTSLRDDRARESAEWWTIQGVLVAYQNFANNKLHLGAKSE